MVCKGVEGGGLFVDRRKSGESEREIETLQNDGKGNKAVWRRLLHR